MLAELHHLSTSLRSFGLQPAECHPWVTALEKGDFIVAYIDGKGSITEIEFCTSAEDSGIAKIRKDNFNGFPALKLSAPIWAVGADVPGRDEWAKADTQRQRAEILTSLCKDAEFREATAPRRSPVARMREFARELHARFEPSAAELPALMRTMKAVLVDTFDTDEFLRQISALLLKAVAVSDPQHAEMALDVLVGARKRGKVAGRKITVLLDDAERRSGEMRVKHAGMAAIYHRVLLATESHGGPTGLCSVTGQRQELELETLPKPKLPELNETILMAMNPETPCLDRYGMIGAAVFPIGRQTAKQLNSAALWITSAERENKTWRRVPRNDGGSKSPANDLLLVYLAQKPDLNADLAALLGGSAELQAEGDFEARAQSVLVALAGNDVPADGVIHTLLLRRINKGQVQVELSREYEVDRIRRGVRDWHRAAANVPVIRVKIPRRRGEPAENWSSRCPSPGLVARATRSVWVRAGTQEQQVAGCDLALVHDLMLAETVESREAASAILGRMLRQSGGLIARCAEHTHRSGPSATDMPRVARQAAVAAATILAMCLYRLERKREAYMNEPAFLLGRFLALADKLHEQYCEAVRDGSIPPQLLGYQHFAMVADNPEAGLAALRSRLLVYYQWARTARAAEGEDKRSRTLRIGRWAMARMSEVTPRLSRSIGSAPLDENGQAEMLLGYLARIEDSETGKEDGEKGREQSNG